MIRLSTIVFALTLLVPNLATNPRIVDHGDTKGKATSSRANELELMEAGQLPRLPRIRTGRTESGSDSDYSSASLVSALDQELEFPGLLDDLDPDQPGPSSRQQQIELQQQRQETRLEELRSQQQQDIALTIAPPAHDMSREVELASHASPSAPSEASNRSSSASSALSNLTSDEARCLRCFASCLDCVLGPEEALSAYCEAGTGRCACGREGWNCAMTFTMCCSFISSFTFGLGLLALRSSGGQQ